nr:NAD(P)/FAD-dependent oxidoreductase [Polymorphobacter sp.]
MAEAFTDSEADIRAHLEPANIPALLAALIHFTGNADHLDAFPLPVTDVSTWGDENGGIPADKQAEARVLAAGHLVRWRDAGYPALPRPSAAAVDRAMHYVAGGLVPPEYTDLLTSELHLDGTPSASGVSIDAPDARKSAFPVLVIGAGMSGLLAGIALKEAGIPFTIIDAQDRVGGTWTANRYPGVRVDTPNHLYSYSFEPAHEWPYRYSTGSVLQDYFERIASKYGLHEHIRFRTRVVAARWDGAAWQASLSGPEGSETVTARAMISAVGQLNTPKLPDIPGVGSFAGPAFHSALWPDGIDLAGKRVAVIGTGASAFQIVPEIAASVASLSVFQRTPPWLLPSAVYHEAVPEGVRWLLRHMPFYANWNRFGLFWSLTEFLRPAVSRTEGWNQPGSLSPMNAELRMLLEAALTAQLSDRPDLLAKSIPPYAPGGKRMLVDNGVWATALKRDNVELITDAITGIEPSGVRLASGRAVEVDVIIYATGFTASEFLAPMHITGEGGQDLHTVWDGDARAYLGMTVPGFPNFFMIYGPNTNIVVNGSIVFFSECSVRYIMGCLKLLIEDGVTSLTPRADVTAAFNEKVDAENARMAWAAPDVNSWYKNAKGRVAQNWPFALVDYWNATRVPERADFEVAE